MKKKFFVTGTDTDVGKTLVVCALLHKANEKKLTTLGLKPIAAGCDKYEGVWQNEDARLLIEYSSIKRDYQEVNPIALKEAIAPHIAAQRQEKSLSVDRIVGYCRGAMMSNANLTLIEGAGGWYVPLNHQHDMSDLVRELNVPVIVVVGIRLGCLNHALLTYDAVLKKGLKVAGWVATHLSDNMPVAKENVLTLQQKLAAPCLGVIPYKPDITPAEAASFCTLGALYE